MSESYSVKAILSATDKGFSSTLKSGLSTLDKFDKKISGFSFGLMTGAGQAAFNMLTNGAAGMVSEVNQSSKAWQTFEGNMKNFGKSDKYIATVKEELQDFAQKTVYSSSDMASTFAQLEAVGVKNTTGLVKGFGGLAAAAENPQQAMKSLSQQATQMAAKPKVAWEDFKIMLEQSPAGMAAVAKSMGMSTEKLITKIQKGEIKTNDFFAAVEKAGNSEGFQEQATKAKTVDQAMDGLKETIGNKLLPTFNDLSQIGINAINKIADSIGKIDAESIATKVSGWVEKAKPYWESFKQTAIEIGGVIKKVGGFFAEHGETIAKAVPHIVKLALAYKAFKVVSAVAAPVAGFTKSIAALAGKGIGGIAGKLFGISKGQQQVGKSSVESGTYMLTAAKSYALMGVAVLLIAAGFALLAQSAIALANAGGLAIGVMAGLVIGVAAMGIGMAVLLKSLAPMGAQLMPVALAMLAMGAAVLLVSAGFALLAATSIQLASAGGAAIGIMVGMVATIALLAVGAAALAPVLTAGAVGLIAFGAAVLMAGAGVALLGAGALMAATALRLVASVLPTIVMYGTQGATAIALLGASMLVFAAGAGLAGAAAIVLGAGLVVAAVGATALAVGVIALAVGVGLAGAAMAVAAAGLALLNMALPRTIANSAAASVAMVALSAGLLILGAGALVASAGLIALGASALIAGAGIIVFGAGMIVGAAGTLIMAAGLKAVSSQMKTISKSAKTAQKSLTSMRNSVKVVESGLSALGSKAKSALNSLKNAFDKSASSAKSAGQKVGTNFANGMKPGLSKAVLNAKTTVNKTVSAFMSGYSGAYSAGAYISKGFANGMRSQLGAIEAAAARMAAAAEKAIRAKAQIHSPSRVADKLGQYFGGGYVGGILSKVKDAANAAKELVTIPQVKTPAFAGAYGYEMSSDYDYSSNHEYIIEVPLAVDGKEFARATANYTQNELNKKQARDSRKKGIV